MRLAHALSPARHFPKRPCVVSKFSFQIPLFVLRDERMLGMLRKLLLLCVLVASVAWAQETRHFMFRYGFTVKNLSPGERVRVWIPAAHSDDFQETRVISATGDLPLKKSREPRFGNEMYYAETTKSKPELHFANRLRRGAP
jgi:hypothetical protein